MSKTTFNKNDDRTNWLVIIAVITFIIAVITFRRKRAKAKQLEKNWVVVEKVQKSQESYDIILYNKISKENMNVHVPSTIADNYKNGDIYN